MIAARDRFWLRTRRLTAACLWLAAVSIMLKLGRHRWLTPPTIADLERSGTLLRDEIAYWRGRD